MPEYDDHIIENGVVLSTAMALKQLQDLLSIPGPSAWAACKALGRQQDTESLAIIIGLMHSSDWRYRRCAVAAVASHSLGITAADEILALLKDSSPYVVRQACLTVADLHLDKGHTAVLQLTTSADPATRQVALIALSKIWEPSDFAYVLDRYLHESNGTIKREAAWILHKHRSADTWQVLFKLWLTDDLPRHRIWATQLAGEFGPASIKSALEVLLTDKDGHVRQAAKRAIEHLQLKSDAD